jgi:hypothetical protein
MTEKTTTIKEFQTMVHALAKRNRFHDTTEAEHIARTTANIHGEVSEFWEAYRKGHLKDGCDKLDANGKPILKKSWRNALRLCVTRHRLMT